MHVQKRFLDFVPETLPVVKSRNTSSAIELFSDLYECELGAQTCSSPLGSGRRYYFQDFNSSFGWLPAWGQISHATSGSSAIKTVAY